MSCFTSFKNKESDLESADNLQKRKFFDVPFGCPLLIFRIAVVTPCCIMLRNNFIMNFKTDQ